MSAALEQSERKTEMRRVRKRKEVKRRHVVNLSDAMSWWLKENYQQFGFDSGPALLRAAIEGKGITDVTGCTLKEMDLAYKKHQRDQIDREIERMSEEED